MIRYTTSKIVARAGNGLFKSTFLIAGSRSFHLGPSQTLAWFNSRNAKKQKSNLAKFTIDPVSTLSASSTLEDTIIALQHVYRDQTITALSKEQKLKQLVLQIIEKSPDNFILNEHLKIVDNALKYVLMENNTTNKSTPMSDNEMIQILKASIKNLNLDQVHDLSFIPVLYKKLSNSPKLQQDHQKRLEILEIFINYILLSNERYQFLRLIEMYIAKHPDQVTDVVIMSLDALRNTSPDTKSILALAHHYNFQDTSQNQLMVQLFTDACTEEVHQDVSKNEIEAKMMTFATILKDKLTGKDEAHSLLNFQLLKFCSDHSLDSAAILLLQLTTKEMSFLPTEPEIMGELLLIGMKYQNPQQICDKIMSRTEYHTELALEWGLYNNASDINEFKTLLEERFAESFMDTAYYNNLLRVCLYSSKSKEFINEFDTICEEEYDVAKDIETFKILIDHSLDGGEIHQAQQMFQMSIQDEFIDWSSPSTGPGNNKNNNNDVLFRLFTSYIVQEEDVPKIHQMYQQMKNFKIQLDESATTAYFSKLVDKLYIGDSLTLLEKEVEPNIAEDHKLRPEMEYSKVYDKLLEFVLGYNEDFSVNHRCYVQLDTLFQIKTEDYYALLDKFCQLGQPQIAMAIFTKFREYAKQHMIQQPPTEKHYILLFEKFGQLLYEDGINQLHLMMRIDMNITPNVHLLNSAMESFTNIQELLQVRDLFDVVMALPEGPDRGLNSRSITIMLKCQTHTTAVHLRNFWNNLSALNYFPTRSNYKQYLIGFCHHDCSEEAVEMIEDWQKHQELEIDDEILAICYNHIPTPEGRAYVQNHFEETYPAIWQKVVENKMIVNDINDDPPPLSTTGRDEVLYLPA